MRLLLVEDEAIFAEKLVEWLERAGYAVDHATTSNAADALFKSEVYRVVVLDIGLPGMNGLRSLFAGLRGGYLRSSPLAVMFLKLRAVRWNALTAWFTR